MSKPTAVAVVVAAISAGALALAIGPLDPPAGPVTESSPSLAELNAQVDLLIAGSAATTPFDFFRSPETGVFSSSLNAVLVADGPVFVESLTLQYAEATIFDGPGTINNDPLVTSG